MKLALHRSIIFWSGILVMGFICWAWWDSQRIVSRVSSPPVHVSMLEGTMGIEYYPRAGNRLKMSRAEIHRGSLEYTAFPFPRPRFARGSFREGQPNPVRASRSTIHESIVDHMDIRTGDCWVFFLPHWLILLLVTLVWFVLLHWRKKRRTRASLDR